MKSFLATLSLATLSLCSPVAQSATSAPPAFKIKNVVSGGSGCPQGSIDIDYTNSGIMPIYFSRDFTATVGPNVAADQSRKNCQINVDLVYSPGWSYAVYSADYSGWADIDSGVTGVVRANYYFSGQTAQTTTSTYLNGPYTGKYSKHDDIAITSWSPCGAEAMLNVNAEVALTPLGGSGTGTIAALKESARFTHQLYIKWKQC